MPYMTKETGTKLTKLILIGMAVQVLVIGYVFYQSYSGRADVVDAQRNGCERNKLDRSANAEGWRAAQNARLASATKDLNIPFATAVLMVKGPSKDGESPDIIAARKYDKIAAGLEKRSRLNCEKAFPKAGLLP